MKAKVWIAVGVVVAAFAAYASKLVWDAGAFVAIVPLLPGECVSLGEMPGPEDIEIASRKRVAFVTSHLRVPHGKGQPVNGGLYLLELDRPGAIPELLWSPSFDFRPHGLGVFEDKNGTTLFLVNHRPDRDTVEVLRYADKKVELIRTIESPLAYNANDIAAVDHERFYQTHDHGARTEIGKKWEAYSRRGRGFITHFDGKEYRVVAADIAFANGVIPSADRTRLYVSAMMGKKIIEFRRDDAGDLHQEWSVALPAAPDNVSLDEAGNLLIAAHPNLFALKRQSEDLSVAAPSKIFRLLAPLGQDAKLEELLVDDGKRIASASVAVRVGDRLLVGSVFDARLLDCRLK